MDMAIIRKNFMEIGGHDWELRGVWPEQYHSCRECGVLPMRNGGHGVCPSAPPEVKAEKAERDRITQERLDRYIRNLPENRGREYARGA